MKAAKEYLFFHILSIQTTEKNAVNTGKTGSAAL